MRRKDSKNANGLGIWKAPSRSITVGMEALRKNFAETMNRRRAAQVRDAAANRTVAEALEKEWTKAGFNVDSISAISRENAARYEANMKKYRNRKPPRNVKDSRLASYLSEQKLRNFAPSPFSPQFSIVRTPPYDVFDLFTPSPLPTGSFFFANASFDGGMNYFLDTPFAAPAPSNFDAGGAVGITFSPPQPFGNAFLGITSVQMNAGSSVEMTGNVNANFSGISHSQGDIGWTVEEFDEGGNFLGFIEDTSADEYYLDASFGTWHESAFFAPTTFTSQTSFLTFPGNNYIILVTLWGNISASGAEGPWASQAAGFGMMAVQSITVTWSLFFF